MTSGDNDESTSTRLERLSRCVPEVINARDWAFTSNDAQELLANVSADFMCRLDPHPQPLTLGEQVKAWADRSRETPEFWIELQDVTSNVDQGTGEASVYLDMIFKGVGKFNLHTIAEMKWRRRGNWWKLYWVHALRGMPEPGGEFDSRVS